MSSTEHSAHVWSSAVLAAGAGTRLRTGRSKPLQQLAGLPLIRYALNALEDAGFDPPVIVRGPSVDLPDALADEYAFVIQPEPDGTGGALAPVVGDLPDGVTHLLVVNGDSPLIAPSSLRRLRAAHTDRPGAVITLLTATGAPGSGLGRVSRTPGGAVDRIIEASEPGHEDAGPDVNAGAYGIDVAWLRANMPRLRVRPNGERYLTDLVSVATADGHRVETVPADRAEEALGINTLVDLAHAERIVRSEILEQLMLSGVTVMDPATTYIDATARIAPGSIIRPNTHISGNSAVGPDCEIGPDAQITDSTIGAACAIWSSALESAVVEDGVTVGPYSHLRPGTHLSNGVHVGSFGEIKASRLGRNTAMGHFGYVGDADVGDDVNIGAGTVTCNYDGTDKHRTVVGDGVFIGSGTMLVAPVTVGAGAYTGAGTVVTRNVAPGTRVWGSPARPQ